jgi:hypothetical protein
MEIVVMGDTCIFSDTYCNTFLYLLTCISIVGFFLLYAKLEEEHGLARHAMAVYDRATKAVLPEEQNEVKYSSI